MEIKLTCITLPLLSLMIMKERRDEVSCFTFILSTCHIIYIHIVISFNLISCI